MQKKITIILFLIFFLGCKSYPDTLLYSLYYLDNNPPGDAEQWMNNKKKYTRNVSVTFSRIGNNIRKDIGFDLCFDKPYKILNLKKMYFCIENSNEQLIILENIKYKLPKLVTYEKNFRSDYYYSQNGYYWTRDPIPLVSSLKKKTISTVDMTQIFHNKKIIGDEFNVSLTLIYSLDNGKEITEVTPFKVRVLEFDIRPFWESW